MLNNPSRLFSRPNRATHQTEWFFKTSEGLMGPYESQSEAETTLHHFVDLCKSGAWQLGGGQSTSQSGLR